MGKKRESLIGIGFVFLALLLVYILSSFNTSPATSADPAIVPNSPAEGTGETPTGTETDTPNGTSNGSPSGSTTGTSSESSTENSTGPSTGTEGETPESQPDLDEKTFVIPESPFGTLGIILDFALAFGIFAQKN